MCDESWQDMQRLHTWSALLFDVSALFNWRSVGPNAARASLSDLIGLIRAIHSAHSPATTSVTALSAGSNHPSVFIVLISRYIYSPSDLPSFLRCTPEASFTTLDLQNFTDAVIFKNYSHPLNFFIFIMLQPKTSEHFIVLLCYTPTQDKGGIHLYSALFYPYRK